MKRRTLDIMFSIGGLLLALLLAIGVWVLRSDANFSKDSVRDQLSREKFSFAAVDKLTPQDKAYSAARTGCLFTNAGQTVTTGGQAECYANEYIGSHLTYLATRLGMTSVTDLDGQNYLQLGIAQADVRAKIATAKTANDPTLPQLEQRLADVTALRTKYFEGTMLRNALLTTYGFAVLGDRAWTGARVAFIGAAVLGLLAIAGFVHAFVTPKSRAFAPVESIRKEAPPRVGATA